MNVIDDCIAFCNHQPMTSTSEPSADNGYALDLSPEAIMARAGREHAMLDRMAVLGMRLVEEVAQRAVDSPYHPEVKHEPMRAFAQVTRVVRFTLAFQTRIEARMIALRNGKPVSSVGSNVSLTPSNLFRQRARDAVIDAIDFEISPRDIAERALDRLHENLIDRETYDALLTLPFRGCVEAICADLGLDPDWSGWSDDSGFAEPPDRRRRDWRPRWATPRSASDEIERGPIRPDEALGREPGIQLEPA